MTTQKTIKEATEVELKAQFYDLQVVIQDAQAMQNAINQELAARIQAKQTKTAVEVSTSALVEGKKKGK